MRKNVYKKVPESLQGKLIAITAIEPGAGKSYFKEDRVKKLRADGYRVRSLGTTQIVSQDQTLCSYLKLYDNKNNEFKSYINNRKKHPKTSAFIFIDEAWMMSQEYINALVEDFPYCCFIIIGDPSQLEGVDTSTNGMTVINKADVNIELSGSHRTSDERLLNFMHDLKNGRINFDLLKTRIRDTNDDDLFITYTHNDKNTYNKYIEYFSPTYKGRYFYSMRGYHSSNGKLSFDSRDKEWTDSWKNMELWRVDDISPESVSLSSLTDNARTISNVPFEIFMKYFNKANAVNIHKVQGISLKDTSISVYPYDSGFKGSYLSVLRQLYVMVSRASSWDNISIPEFAYNKLYNKFANHLTAPLNFQISAELKYISTSEELCNLNNIQWLKLLQYPAPASSPVGGVSLSNLGTLCIYNMCGMHQTYTPPVYSAPTAETSTNAPVYRGYSPEINLHPLNKLTPPLTGTRNSGGRGHKYDGNLSRGQRQKVLAYIKSHNGSLNNAWSDEQTNYAIAWLDNHIEYKEKQMETYDKYDEIINEKVNTLDLMYGNKQYADYIMDLHNQYSKILGDLISPIEAEDNSQELADLTKFLRSYKGKKGLHIVYIYENFSPNLARSIIAGKVPGLKEYNYKVYLNE